MDPDINEKVPLGQYMHQHTVTDISELIQREGDSEDVKLVKGNHTYFKFPYFDENVSQQEPWSRN